MKIIAAQGDITQQDVDAIFTTINMAGDWMGGVDKAIYRVAGGTYHQHAADAFPLHDGQIIVAKGDKTTHGGQFNDVVFIVDKPAQRVGNIMLKALLEAKKQGYKSIAITAFRTGVMLRQGIANLQITLSEIVLAVNHFASKNEDLDMTVTFIAYDEDMAKILEDLAPKMNYTPYGDSD